jgi:hypothetical protein
MAADGDKAEPTTPVQQTATAAATKTGKNGASGDKSAQTPDDAAKAFLQASVKWPDEKGDRNVSLAFLLGWRMWRAVEWSDTVDERETPGIEDPAARFTVLSGQIDAAVTALTSAAGASTFAATYGAAQTERAKVRDTILGGLYAKDASLGKAAYLGHQLHGFSSPKGKEEHLVLGATHELRLLLVALATKLPPNAAHTVLNSLTLWEHERADKVEVPRTRLEQQGRIWRSFLAGETAAKDVLHVSDYIGTADQLVRRVRELFRRSLTGGLAILSLVVLVLLAVGVWLILHFDETKYVITGASSVVAAFGLTWKGIGQFFGNAVAKAEQALWDSELNWTIAYRSMVGRTPVEQLPKKRKTRRDAHYKTYTSWAKKWPDTEIDSDDPAPGGTK